MPQDYAPIQVFIILPLFKSTHYIAHPEESYPWVPFLSNQRNKGHLRIFCSQEFKRNEKCLSINNKERELSYLSTETYHMPFNSNILLSLSDRSTNANLTRTKEISRQTRTSLIVLPKPLSNVYISLFHQSHLGEVGDVANAGGDYRWSLL